MKRVVAWIGLLLALAAPPLAGAAVEKGLNFRPGGQVFIRSDRINYYKSSNLYLAEGGVEVRYGENTLNADKVVLDRANKVFTATGHVRLSDGQSVLTSERVAARLDERTGVIFGGQIFLRDSGYRFSGERIEKIGEDEFIIRRGSITTCNCGPNDPPSWEIGARSMWVKVGGYARVQNAVFYVQGVPVLYLPFGFFPVKTQREFGLLFPTLAYGAVRGIEIHEGLFIPFGDSADATLAANYYSYQGYGASAEFRYAGRRGSYGTTNFEWLRQSKEGGQPLGYVRDRFSIDATHRYNFGPYESAVADLHFVSDRLYFADLANTLQEKTRPFTHSELAYINSGERVSLLGQAELWERLGSGFGSNANRMPHVELTAPPQALFERGPVLFARASADNFVVKSSESELFDVPAYHTIAQRADFTVRVEQPLNFRVGILTPFAAGRETAYRLSAAEPAPAGRSLHREFGVAGTRLAFPFERTFGYSAFATGPADRAVVHRVSPIAKYLYMPDVSQASLPQLDESDLLRPRNLVQYGVENQLIWGGAGALAGRATLDVYRQYAFGVTGAIDPESPLLGRASLEFAGGLGLSATEYYDPKAERYKNYHGVYRVQGTAGGVAAAVEYHRLSNYRVDDQSRVVVDEDVDNTYTRYAAPLPWASREVWGTLSRNFFEHLTLTYGARYSLDRRIFLESIYGASFLSLCNCWSVTGNFIQRPNNDLRFSVAFTLVGIGSFGN
jgi:LPS-assembly protein